MEGKEAGLGKESHRLQCRSGKVSRLQVPLEDAGGEEMPRPSFLIPC